MSGRIAGSELDRPLVLRLRRRPVPSVKVQGESKSGMGLTEAFVQRQGLARRRLGLDEGRLRGNDPIFPIARKCVGISQTCVGLGEGWIGLDRVTEIADGRLQPVSCAFIQEVGPLHPGGREQPAYRSTMVERGFQR
jgi:hypothetical protein